MPVGQLGKINIESGSRNYEVVSNSTLHFTGALAQNVDEMEDFAQLDTSRIVIQEVDIVSMLAKHYAIILWGSATGPNANLELDTHKGYIDVDIATNGIQRGGAGPWYFEERLAGESNYTDEDAVNVAAGKYTLHCSLMNLDVAAKAAGAAGAIKVTFKVAPRL